MITELLRRITKLLEINHIQYMLSGGLALNAYTVPRMSLDIDFIIELHKANINKFLEIFKHGYYINSDVVMDELKRRGMFNVIDHLTGFKIDFIILKDSEYRRLEFARRRRERIADFEVWIVSPEDLIVSKIFWIQSLYSDRQINDIKNLLTVPDLDKEYIKNWCGRLKLNTFELI
ncbi:MAG: hypothetical protein HY738_19465 [Bacteroidia bacterium]|nr:hypothetical protein [Bacteroidia bacterium]